VKKKAKRMRRWFVMVGEALWGSFLGCKWNIIQDFLMDLSGILCGRISHITKIRDFDADGDFVGIYWGCNRDIKI
jgi:hypothetical protein